MIKGATTASIFSLLATGMALTIAPESRAADAPSAREQEIICRLSGTCDQANTETDAQGDSRSIDGGEKAFSVVSSQSANRSSPSTPKTTSSSAGGSPKFYKSPQGKAGDSPPGRGKSNQFQPPKTVAPASARRDSVDVRVAFANGSAELDASSREDIRAFARALQSSSLASGAFVVEGHTNSVGARDYNMDLSQRRAQAVLDYLVAQGVPVSRLEAKGFGFDKPRTRNPADARNRRVEIVRAR